MKKLLLALLLLATPASAEVLNRTLTLASATNRTTTLTGTITSLAAVADYRSVGGVACRAVASNVSGTNPTLDIVVQTCTDETATNCDTVCTFTQCTTGSCWTDGSATIDLGNTTNVFTHFRAIATVAGTNSAYNIPTIEIRY